MNVHKASLSDACAEKEVRHHPALIFRKVAFLNIGLFEKQLKLLLVIGLDMAFIYLDGLHLEIGKITLVHKEVQGSDEVAQIGIDADVVIKS